MSRYHNVLKVISFRDEIEGGEGNENYSLCMRKTDDNFVAAQARRENSFASVEYDLKLFFCSLDNDEIVALNYRFKVSLPNRFFYSLNHENFPHRSRGQKLSGKRTFETSSEAKMMKFFFEFHRVVCLTKAQFSRCNNNTSCINIRPHFSLCLANFFLLFIQFFVFCFKNMFPDEPNEQLFKIRSSNDDEKLLKSFSSFTVA